MSTGYPQYMFHREQPSSSGQQFTATAGCQMEFESGALLEMESGSTMNVKAGGFISVEADGILNLENGSQVREAVTAHTSLTKNTIMNSGISSISAATSAIVFTMEAPVAGLTKTIIPLSTKVMYLRGSSGPIATTKVQFGTTGKFKLKIEMLAAGKAEGAAFILKSMSTIKWMPIMPSTINLKVTQTTASTA